MLCARKGTVTAMSEKIVNSVKKALDILDILIFEDIDRRGISLKELSERSGIRPNTLHNILKTMKQCGFSRKGISRKPGSVCPEKKRYTAGIEAYAAGNAKNCGNDKIYRSIKQGENTGGIMLI